MPLALRIERLDATRVRGARALVVPANRQLTLGWGSHLAEKVARLAGPGVEAEALAAHPGGVGLGEAVLTGAGRLEGFTHLVHAAVLDKYDFNPLFLLRLRERTRPETLQAATRNSLERLHESGLASAVFTPMGAGIGGMRREKCAWIMVAQFADFAARRPDSPLVEVIVACLDAKTERAFLEAREALPTR